VIYEIRIRTATIFNVLMTIYRRYIDAILLYKTFLHKNIHKIHKNISIAFAMNFKRVFLRKYIERFSFCVTIRNVKFFNERFLLILLDSSMP